MHTLSLKQGSGQAPLPCKKAFMELHYLFQSQLGTQISFRRLTRVKFVIRDIYHGMEGPLAWPAMSPVACQRHSASSQSVHGYQHTLIPISCTPETHATMHQHLAILAQQLLCVSVCMQVSRESK